MSASSASDHEFFRLLWAACDNQATADECAHLEQRVLDDPEACRAYVLFMSLHTDLLWQNQTSEIVASGEQQTAVSIQQPSASEETNPKSGTRKQKSASPTLGFLGRTVSALNRPVVWSIVVVAAAFYGTFTVISWNLRPGKLSRDLSPFAVSSQQMGSAPLSSVAVVRDSADVQWSKNIASKSTKSSILSGEPLRIVSGTVELELSAGTRLVVKGPADWTVDGANHVLLRAGKLMARVPRQAIGFTVETPTARVVDVGTEFGMEVNEAGATDVSVLKGVVEVDQLRSTSETSKRLPKRRLVAGQTVRVNRSGLGEVLMTSRASATKSAQGSATLTTIDLVDIVAGGDGRNHGRDRGIDPTNGRTLAMSEPDRSKFGALLNFPSGFHAVDELPMVDGVGIPESIGVTRVTSANHTFQFPQNDATCYGPIWAGGQVPENNGVPICTHFEGTVDFSLAPHGLIALIPNKLITFDLAAIRREYPDQSLATFRAIVGMTVMSERNGALADTWVLIDGVVRHKRRSINATDGPEIVEIHLQPGDSFLTLAATDGGNTPHCDWILFADPRIELDAKK